MPATQKKQQRPSKNDPLSYKYYSARPKLDRLSTQLERPACGHPVKPSLLKVVPRKGGLLTGDLSGCVKQTGKP
jgi:hypothetical protein